MSPGRGLLKSENGEFLNLKSDSLSKGPNNPLSKEVRRAMLKGERHPSCQRCYSEEDAGMVSRRQAEIVEWEFEITKERIFRETGLDGQIHSDQFPLVYLDLRFGNRCNLKCRMCGPTESDQWYKVHTKLSGDVPFKEGPRKLEIVKDENNVYGLKVDPYKWYENESFWEDLEKHLPQMKRIYLAGGEPLLIDRQFELLSKCVENGYSKNIILEYNSNITALTDKILNTWSHFKKVEIGISVDGVGPVNDYIRFPSKWDQVNKNIKRLDEAKGNFKLWLAPTIQIYNMLHFPEMMTWVIEQNYNRINRSMIGKEILTPHPLSNPNPLSIKVFPEKSKKLILQRFEEEKLKLKEKIIDMDFYNDIEKERRLARFGSLLDSYAAFMMSKNMEHLKEKFWAYTNGLDEIHGTSFREVCPEAYELML